MRIAVHKYYIPPTPSNKPRERHAVRHKAMRTKQFYHVLAPISVKNVK